MKLNLSRCNNFLSIISTTVSLYYRIIPTNFDLDAITLTAQLRISPNSLNLQTKNSLKENSVFARCQK